MLNKISINTILLQKQFYAMDKQKLVKNYAINIQKFIKSILILFKVSIKYNFLCLFIVNNVPILATFMFAFYPGLQIL